MEDRTGVFVDVISLFGAVKSAYDGKKIDYGKYLDKIEEKGHKIYRAYAYGAFIDDESIGFVNCLDMIGFKIRYVRATIIDNKPDIKRTDRSIDIICDILTVIDKIDTVIIGTLNTNMIGFIEYLKSKGIKVIIYACNVKRELRDNADEYWHIEESILEAPVETIAK